MPRFSLKWMLAGVAAVALGTVALLYASPLTYAITLGFALLLLLSAPLGVIYRTGARRAFWVGFTVFGWCYLLALIAGASTSRTSFRGLPSHALQEYVYARVPMRIDSEEASPPVLNVRPVGRLFTFTLPSEVHFRRVFHSLFIILWAVLGGLIARCFYATRGSATDEAA